MKKALILMATYNGGKFLRAQLDSILAQTHRDWTLYARDDGSQDETVEILAEYKARDSRIDYAVNASGVHGAFLNFHSLIRIARERLAQFDAIAFADQDDVWRTCKLERQLKALEEAGEGPVLVYSDFSVTDESGKVIIPSQHRLSDMRVKGHVDGLFLRKVWGCTMLASRALIALLPPDPKKNEDMLAHDVYLETYATMYGRTVFVSEPLVLYRRHGDNASTLFSALARRSPLQKLAEFSGYSRRLARAFVLSESILAEILRHDPKNARAHGALRAIEKGGLHAVLFCVRSGVSCDRLYKTAALYLALATGSYKMALRDFYAQRGAVS